MATLIADTPRHIYCYVDRSFLGDATGFEPCSLFGITSMPNRAWGHSVLLECGAVYSHVPPHALAFSEKPRAAEWSLQEAQVWDCFGVEFAVHEYAQLAGRDVDAYVLGEWLPGEYLFTAQHFADGYSREPSQAKQYHWIRLANDRLTILPGNRMLVHDPAFTRVAGKPSWLRVQRDVYTCESRNPWDRTIGEETG